MDSKFNLCILGTDPFGLILELLAIQRVNGRRVELHRLQLSDQDKNCHLLFLAEDATSSGGPMLRDFRRRGLFIVGDLPGLASRGAAASFLAEGDTTLFEINIAAARRAGLILDTPLLRLGRLQVDNDDILQ